jgi:hypothetical protein
VDIAIYWQAVGLSRYLWELEHPALDEATRAALKDWARKVESRVKWRAADASTVPLDVTKLPRLVPLR